MRDFLLRGRKNRNFRVVVCESGPSLIGHKMAKELSDGGIETTLIADSAAFAIIHAVNKVCVCRAAVMIHPEDFQLKSGRYSNNCTAVM